MEKQKKALWQKQLVFAAIATVVFMSAGTLAAYSPGDRVECDTTGSFEYTGSAKYFLKGTIVPFKPGDFGKGLKPDGSWYRFKAEDNHVEYFCKPEVIRPIAGADVKEPVKKVVETKGTNEKAQEYEKNISAAGDFLDCPIAQKQVKNSSRPEVELFKKIIRCKKGEKAVERGGEGAVKVEVTALKVGASRPWSYNQDIGNSKPGTVVYPVKTTYTVKTLYRTATEVETDAIRILNFYVNAFGEWQIGSEEPIKSAKTKRIPK